MGRMGLWCVALATVLGLCLAFPAVGEEPGDALLEVFEKDIKPAESLLPPGVTVVEGFQPGAGDAIGTVKSIKGRMLVVHRGENAAYAIQKDHPLFSFDTLVTEQETRAEIEFNDSSSITLGTYTKIVLDKSIYDPSKSTRESFLRLLFGKARFIVTKLANFRSSQYKVKTPTAVVGVRGSDFAVAVAPGSPLTTTLATGKNTTVLFVGNTGPAQVIGPMRAATARVDQAATTGMNITRYPPTTFASTGTPTYMKVAAGVGGALVIGGALAAGDSGSEKSAISFTASAVPSAGSIVSGGSPQDIIFTFTNDIRTGTSSAITISSSDPEWVINSITENDLRTITVTVNHPSAPSVGFVLDLSGVQNTEGKFLEPPTSFDYIPF